MYFIWEEGWFYLVYLVVIFKYVFKSLKGILIKFIVLIFIL